MPSSIGNAIANGSHLVFNRGLVWDTSFWGSVKAEGLGRRWDVGARVLAAVLLGYLVTNTVGIAVGLALPVTKPSAVAGATIASFLLWALIAMWVFSVRRTRTVWLGLLAALGASGAVAGLLIASQGSA